MKVQPSAMSTIRTKRSAFGWLLLLVVGGWSVALFYHARGELSTPYGRWALVIGLSIAVACLAWLYFRRHVVLTVDEGFLTVPSWFGDIRIPVSMIASARIARYGLGEYLEVSLTEVPATLRRYQDTFAKRRALAVGRRYGYQPPPKPFLLFDVAFPDCTDAGLTSLIDLERLKVVAASEPGDNTPRTTVG
jgi:hypothetical protein